MLANKLYSLVQKYGLMFQMHPSEIGPTVTLLFCKKDAAIAYELYLTEDKWLLYCDNGLENLFEEARDFIDSREKLLEETMDYIDSMKNEKKDVSNG